MHADIDKTYAMVYSTIGMELSRRVEICETVANIIKYHFGTGEMKVMDLPEMVQKYWSRVETSSTL